MDIDFLMKIVGIAMTVAVSCQILSRVGREDQSTLVSVGGIVILLMLLFGEIGELFATVRDIFGI